MKTTAAAGAPPTSLAEILRRRQQGVDVSQAVIEEFARHVLVDWRIQNNVFAISRALTGDPASGGTDGLFWTWAELFTTKMVARTGSASLKASYDMLEHSFLRYVGTQMLGVFLVLILDMYVHHQNRQGSNVRTGAAVDLTMKDISVYWV